MQHPTKTKDDFGSRMRLELDPPFVWRKTHPIRSDDYAIQMSILGIGRQNRPPIVTEHRVVGTNGYLGQIGESDCADWALNGDLLFAQSGCLFRLRREGGKFGPIEESKQIADFNGLEFRRCEAPENAQSWPTSTSKPKD